MKILIKKYRIRNYMNKVTILLLAIVLLAGCSRRGIGFRSDLEVDPFDFQFFTAKAKITFDDGARELSGAANVRVQKDSAIWMSISPGLGVEVARLFISPDSIFFLDRINKKVLKLSFEQISNEYDFDINYNLVESIAIGNLIYPYRRESLTRLENGLTYSQDFDNYSFRNYIGNESRKLESLMVRDLETNTSISVNYGEFKEVGEEIFPFTIKAVLDFAGGDKKPTNISIGFNRAQIENEPLKFPFDIPERYKVL